MSASGTHESPEASVDAGGKDRYVMGRSKSSSSIEVASKTDRGLVRSENEDCHLVLDFAGSKLASAGLTKLLAVADGLGGHAAGGTASHMAIDCLREAFTGPITARLSSRDKALEALVQSFAEANSRIHTAGAPSASLRGMGTTLVAALIGKTGVDICNVGDSRAYVFNESEGLRQITKDHSWEAEFGQHLQAGSAELARASNLLTRALGPQAEVEADVFSESIKSGEILLLCSDGLTGMIDHEEVVSVLADSKSMKAAVEEFVDRANKYGGEDNITVIAARFS
jgi:serine/threonine protein phosphatase PrpC